MEGKKGGPVSLPWLPVFQDSSCSYTFIPYVVTVQSKVLCCDTSAMMCLSELHQPSFNMEAFFTPLTVQLAKLLEDTSTNCW